MESELFLMVKNKQTIIAIKKKNIHLNNFQIKMTNR